MKTRRPMYVNLSDAEWDSLTPEQQQYVEVNFKAAMIPKNKPKSKLLRPKKDSQFWQDVVSAEVFVHEDRVVTDVRSALAAGLKPVSFSLLEQADGYAVVLRLEREES